MKGVDGAIENEALKVAGPKAAQDDSPQTMAQHFLTQIDNLQYFFNQLAPTEHKKWRSSCGNTANSDGIMQTARFKAYEHLTEGRREDQSLPIGRFGLKTQKLGILRIGLGPLKLATGAGLCAGMAAPQPKLDVEHHQPI